MRSFRLALALAAVSLVIGCSQDAPTRPETSEAPLFNRPVSGDTTMTTTQSDSTTERCPTLGTGTCK